MEEMKNPLSVQMSSNSPAVFNSSNLAVLRTDKDKMMPRYWKLPKVKRIDFLCREMSKAIILKHEDLDVDMMRIEADALDLYLLESAQARDLILPELEYAFRQGLVGSYGDYFGITPVSLYGFVEGYVKSKKKWDVSWEESKLSGWNKTREETIRRLEAHKREVEESRAKESVQSSGYDPKMVDHAISSAEHRAKIKEQAEQIFRDAGLL